MARAMLNGPPDVACAKLVFSALVAAAVGRAGVAFAQTTSGGTTSGATVSPSGQPYPIRLSQRVGCLWRTQPPTELREHPAGRT